MTIRIDKLNRLRGLELFYAMYAVTLVLGIEQISDALYKSTQALIHSRISSADYLLNLGVFLSILLLIVRFFWSTGNIKRALKRSSQKKGSKTSKILLLHLPALLLQGVLLLFVCFAYTGNANKSTDSLEVICWFLAVTSWNAIWLVSLGKPTRNPENVWILNNSFLVIVGSLTVGAAFLGMIGIQHAIITFVTLSIASSLFDLSYTAEAYLSDFGR